jgi:hypothetical protein
MISSKDAPDSNNTYVHAGSLIHYIAVEEDCVFDTFFYKFIHNPSINKLKSTRLPTRQKGHPGSMIRLAKEHSGKARTGSRL